MCLFSLFRLSCLHLFQLCLNLAVHISVSRSLLWVFFDCPLTYEYVIDVVVVVVVVVCMVVDQIILQVVTSEWC